MLDICNYFFSNFLKSYKMSVAKIEVPQNCHVCDHSEKRYAKNIEIAVDVLCDFLNSKRGNFKRKIP